MFDELRYDRQAEPAVLYCDLCGGEIYDGTYYWSINGVKLCEDCMDGARRVADREEGRWN